MGTLIRDVWNPIEIKVVLAVAALGATERPVREATLFEQVDIRLGSRGDGSDRSYLERMTEALEVALARGVLLRMVDDDGSRWLLLGTEENLQWTRRLGTGAADHRAPAGVSLILQRPSIFTMYEQNIGLVTPIVADRLVEAIELYPEAWIADAIAEAVAYNRRSWRYVQRILENWAAEGRTDETNRRDSSRDVNREKRLRGKYAHLFERDGLPDL
ncbi:MAG TPA: DnaD domain protein [Thermomicrobiales bacterium]|nr:DnaD domain protein [Thermomicrobiales bacterium]